jgi:ABC-2 type transport system permease protein
VIAAVSQPATRFGLALRELRKLSAFIRRDFLVAWSYRIAFVSDLVHLVGQVLLFYFVGMMIDPKALPTYAGTEVTYLEFAAVGIALAVFMQLGLDRVASALRGEQLMGTLESLLVTPTAPSTIQIGSVAFELIYIPLRTAVFLIAVALVFGLHFDLSGLLPALTLLVVFIPFVWGLGVASAALLMTVRRGSGIIGLGVVGLGLASGIYFPLDLLPDWIATLAALNPIAIAINGMRQALLGGAGWSEVGGDILVLAPMSAASLLLGFTLFRAAIRRERKLGTLGLY